MMLQEAISSSAEQITQAFQRRFIQLLAAIMFCFRQDTVSPTDLMVTQK